MEGIWKQVIIDCMDTLNGEIWKMYVFEVSWYNLTLNIDRINECYLPSNNSQSGFKHKNKVKQIRKPIYMWVSRQQTGNKSSKNKSKS